MTVPYRDVGDSGRVPAPDWYLRILLERAAELLLEIGRPADPDETDDWNERFARWKEIWFEVQASG